MDLQEIQKHVNAAGLVPIYILQPYAPYTAGTIAGFPPAAALLHINGSIGRLTTAKERKASSDAADADPAPVHGSDMQLPQHAYEQRPEVSPRAQTAPATSQRPAAALPPAAIPENWKDLPVAERRKLAANLSLRRYQEISGEQADEIIQAAADHATSDAARAAPAHATVPAAVLTSASVPTASDASGSGSGETVTTGSQGDGGTGGGNGGS